MTEVQQLTVRTGEVHFLEAYEMYWWHSKFDFPKLPVLSRALLLLPVLNGAEDNILTKSQHWDFTEVLTRAVQCPVDPALVLGWRAVLALRQGRLSPSLPKGRVIWLCDSQAGSCDGRNTEGRLCTPSFDQFCSQISDFHTGLETLAYLLLNGVL